MTTQREQVLTYLQSHPVAIDDDQLASALGLRRQVINMICRALADKNIIVRSYDQRTHKLVNHLPLTGAITCYAEAPVVATPNMPEPSASTTSPAPTAAKLGVIVALTDSEAMRAFAYQGEIDLSENLVKATVQHALERDGWKTNVQYGHMHGIDIEATRAEERLVLEVKGEGSLDAMRVNYFLGALGELLQRMDSPTARYGLALPAHRQYIGLIARLPDWVCQRLGLCFYLVRPSAYGFEVGYVLPRASEEEAPAAALRESAD